MNPNVERCYLKGYEEAKAVIDAYDSHGLVTMGAIEQYFDAIEMIGAYYEREFEGYEPYTAGKENIHKHAYVAIKSLLHMCYVTIDEGKAGDIFSSGRRLPQVLHNPNEILCWNVLIQFFKLYLNAIRHKDDEYPPFCESHFDEVMMPFTLTLSKSRNRIGDIKTSYIGVQFDLMEQRLSNISANLVGKLLNRPGFIKYLTYWGRKEGSLTLMLCDLDKFKQINDDNSYAVGDDILRKTANVISAVCEKHSGVPGRFGGEEFWLGFNNSD